MLKVKADLFYWTATLLEQIKTTAALQQDDAKLSEEHRIELLRRLALALQYTDELKLPITGKAVDRLGHSADAHECTYGEVRDALGDITRRFTDELDSTLLFHITSDNQNFLEGARKEMGDDVVNRFPEILFDTEEAGKCLAMGRATACVFHLMRIMEAGLRAVAKALNIDVLANRTWDAVLKKIKATNEQQHPRDEWTNFYTEIVAKGYAVKDAWRNPTMHIEEKYTTEEALDIFRAVRGFLKHISTRLSA
jgi:hypothetical protein